MAVAPDASDLLDDNADVSSPSKAMAAVAASTNNLHQSHKSSSDTATAAAAAAAWVPGAGAMVWGKYTEDDVWYRAEVRIPIVT